MKGRHLARQAALQALTSLLLHKEEVEVVLEFVHKEFASELNNPKFFQELVRGVHEFRSEIDEEIAIFAPQWPIEKLDPVERSILELATFEILKTNTPAPIVINEAVDLAKEFGDDTAGKFVNGVMSSLSKKHGRIE